MSSPRYPEAFKIEAVKQVTERGRHVDEVAKVLGLSDHSRKPGAIQPIYPKVGNSRRP